MTGPLFKVILVGDAGVGKTSLFCCIQDEDYIFRENPTTTVGVESCIHSVSTAKGVVNMSVYDTAGVERFRTLTRNYYRNAHAVLLVFSLDEPASLYGLSRWESEVMESAPAAVKFLVGNKADLHKAVLPEAIQAFAHAHNCQAAFLTSAKTREGLDGALASLGVHLMEKYDRHSHRKDEDRLWREGSGMHVHGDENRGSKCC